MRTLEEGRRQSERCRLAAAEIRELIARLHRGFVAWGSLYEAADPWEEQERRERVAELRRELSNGYLPRSVWLAEGTRKRIENFIKKSGDLYAEFSADIQERGYESARADMAERVSKELGRLKKEIESSLEMETAGQHQPRWRRLLRS